MKILFLFFLMLFVWILFGSIARKMNDKYLTSLYDSEILAAFTWVFGPISFTILFAKYVGEYIYDIFDGNFPDYG